MGIGNYSCSTEENEVVYIDHDQIFSGGGEEDPEEGFSASELATFDWIDFRADVTALATRDPLWASGSPFRTDWYDDMRVIAHSHFYLLGLVDWEGYAALVVSINPEMCYEKGYALAKYNLWRSAERLFVRLAASDFTLRVRSCAWTSSPWQPRSASRSSRCAA